MIKSLKAIFDIFVNRLKKFLYQIVESFQKFFGLIEKEERNYPWLSHRNWPRPRNQRVRPLLLDRRSRVYHCRNAI